MPPVVALCLTVLFIVWVLRRDVRQPPWPSPAIWIPTIWLALIGSRSVSLWIAAATGHYDMRPDEGSSVDQVVYGSLILAGIAVLFSRRIQVGEILRNNAWIWLFIAFEGASVLWSDFPLTAFRRWVKALGDPVMVLVLCTDPRPARAITAAIRRCAFVLVPLSVLFIKYYENLGRRFDNWGTASYTGVTTNKNMLGFLLFAFGLYFVASLLTPRTEPDVTSTEHRAAQRVNALMLLMIVWLLGVANSKTAALALIAGILILIPLRFATVRRHFWIYATAGVLLATISEGVFSISTSVLAASGRDVTLTGRTGLWETLLSEPVNPIVGVGYASFWLGERLERLAAMYPASPPTEAHNGFLEVYLSLGIIGVTLLTLLILAGLRKLRRDLTLPPASTRDERTLRAFALAYAIAYMVYNITEATFQGLSFLFVLFLILVFRPSATVETPPPRRPTPWSARRVAPARFRPVTDRRGWPRR